MRLDLAHIGRSVRCGRGMSTWTWTLRDGEQRSIGMRITEREVTLIYTIRRGESAAIDVRDPVALDKTPCTRGGDRIWFRCPGCDRRVRALHLAPGKDHFRCRHCHRLAYGSQQVAPDERHFMAIRNIQRRIVGGEPDGGGRLIPDRPKGMHRATYDRLVQRLVRHEMEREEIIYAQMRKLVTRIERRERRSRAMRGAGAG